MSKYGPLEAYLAACAEQGQSSVELGFIDVDALVGGLPASARTLRTWWGNSSHSQALAWAEAGWHVDFVSLDRERVRFARGAVGGSYAARGRVAAPKAANPASTPAQERTSHIVLVGCVKSKADRALPARDLYVSPLFGERRRYAEATGLPWFIISSKWGLLNPEEVIAPYDMYLGDQPKPYRSAWGAFVVAQLELALGSLASVTVEIHAGQDYIDPLREHLISRAAEVSTPVEARSMGAMLGWYDQGLHKDTAPAVETIDDAVSHDIAVLSTLEILRDHARSLAPAELLQSDRSALSSPGLYSWWVDARGAADLSAGLDLPVNAGLIYAGLAGATKWPSGKRSSNTLWGRVVGMHLGRTIEFSTFRKTLAAALSISLEMPPVNEGRLTEWMHAHLRVVAWPIADADSLGRVERAVLDELDPPLNLMGMARSPLRSNLGRLRSALS